MITFIGLELSVFPLRMLGGTLILTHPSVSLQAILLLFTVPETRQKYAYRSEKFYNPNITKVSIQVDGETSQLYDQGLLPEHMYENAFKFFGNELSTITQNAFFVSKYCLLVDFRTLKNNMYHYTGLELKNKSIGVNLYAQRKVDSTRGIKLLYAIYLLSKMER